MRITISHSEKPVRITIFHLEGKLDRANYESLIEEAQDVYLEGVRNLILDMGKLTFISSSGESALHQVALLFHEGEKPKKDGGWAAFRSVEHDDKKGPQEHVKLVSPTRSVREVLALSGFDALFEVFSDLPQAVESFRQADSLIKE